MTREEAIAELKRDIELDNDFTEDYLNAINMAIQALEQQPCKDTISRQDVLDILTEQERLASDRVRDTPSSLGNGLHTWVNPAYTRYSAQLSERSQFKTMIQTMSPVISQPKMGRWEWVQYDSIPELGNWHCSECRNIVIVCVSKEEEGGIPLYKYCPHCGAKMEVE